MKKIYVMIAVCFVLFFIGNSYAGILDINRVVDEGTGLLLGYEVEYDVSMLSRLLQRAVVAGIAASGFLFAVGMAFVWLIKMCAVGLYNFFQGSGGQGLDNAYKASRIMRLFK